MQVNEIMTPNPACCTPDSTLLEVAQMMEQYDCGCIPVVDSHSDMRPVGTITDRDITIRTVAADHNPIAMKASDIMTTDIATVTPNMSVEECFDVMEDKEIRRVLVVDAQGKCCGIVAQADVVQSTASPIRTNKVIREISESAPSSHQMARTGMSGGRSYGSRSSSLFGRGGMMPLLIGLGAGSALTYFLSKRSDTTQYDSYSVNSGTYPEDVELLVDTANSEPIGKYRDADEEIENRQQRLENRVQSVLVELDSYTDDESISTGEDDMGSDKSRSAGQG